MEHVTIIATVTLYSVKEFFLTEKKNTPVVPQPLTSLMWDFGFISCSKSCPIYFHILREAFCTVYGQ